MVTVPEIGNGVALNCASVKPSVLTVPEIGNAVALNCASVKPSVLTVPEIGTGDALNCKSVKPPVNGLIKSTCANVNTTGCDAAANCCPSAGVFRFIADSVLSVAALVAKDT